MSSTPTALVVDDNAINRKLMQSILNRLGWSSILCDRGDEAIERLRAQAVDLVLLDLRMPGLGGTETCQRIRNELGLTQLPVVAYTAHAMLEDRAGILAQGFDALLIKPVSVTDVRAICAEFVPAT